MEVYETEEERVEALRKWWKDHGGSVLIGLAVGALVIASWNIWQRSSEQRQQQASTIYQQLLGEVNKDNIEGGNKLAERLAAQYGSSAYGVFGKLFQAKLKVDAKDLPGARKILEDLIKTAPERPLQLLARWRLARVMIAQGEYEPVIKLLSDLGPQGPGGFETAFEETKGDAYWALNRIEEARTSYERAKSKGGMSPLLEMKFREAGGKSDPEGGASHP